MRKEARAAATRRAVPFSDLARFEGGLLEPRRDYDAIDFVDRDFTGQDASEARFLECRLQRCCLDGLSMQRARVVESLLSEVHGASVDLSDATWTGIRVRGSKLGFVNLSGARLEDVVFEGCEIGTLDVRAAQLRSVGVVDCTIDELNVAGATLSKVDLSGARLRSLIGVESLRGAIVSQAQLHDLAPLLAAELGLEVRDDEPDERADPRGPAHAGRIGP
jgi:uncharacterized protein YjbI with pentapeptide repeats